MCSPTIFARTIRAPSLRTTNGIWRPPRRSCPNIWNEISPTRTWPISSNKYRTSIDIVIFDARSCWNMFTRATRRNHGNTWTELMSSATPHTLCLSLSLGFQ
uniref:Uncharacterized protein n=1 Tax=Cacopsylla melanoneura TaxID=428564 RepID=A0A8D8S7B3_9HEMI